VGDGDKWETTLRNTKTATGFYFRLDILHIAVSASVHNTLPVRLADLRVTSKNGAARYAKAPPSPNYEQISSLPHNALPLLQRGIKPGQIAQLLYNLSGLVSLPIIACEVAKNGSR